MPTVDEVKTYVKDQFHVYDRQDTQDYEERLDKAGAYCRQVLDPMIQAWVRLNETIDRCTAGNVSFVEHVRTDAEMRQRWESVRQEGYLLTKIRDKDLRRLTNLLAEDPEGLLSLERYSIRTTYVLGTVKAPGHERNRPARIMPAVQVQALRMPVE